MTTALILGASRGLGLGLAREYLRRGSHVIGTVRSGQTPLHTLAQDHPDQLRIEQVDITDAAALTALRHRLAGTELAVLFVNAGIAKGPGDSIADTTDAEFTHAMATNVLGPARALALLGDLVPPTGVLGAMSSGLGSIARNTNGGWEVYRATKAALNMCLASYAASHPNAAVVSMSPGWVKTDMGGDAAPLTIEQSIPGVVDALTSRAGKPGVVFLGHTGETMPW